MKIPSRIVDSVKVHLIFKMINDYEGEIPLVVSGVYVMVRTSAEENNTNYLSTKALKDKCWDVTY